MAGLKKAGAGIPANVGVSCKGGGIVEGIKSGGVFFGDGLAILLFVVVLLLLLLEVLEAASEEDATAEVGTLFLLESLPFGGVLFCALSAIFALGVLSLLQSVEVLCASFASAGAQQKFTSKAKIIAQTNFFAVGQLTQLQNF